MSVMNIDEYIKESCEIEPRTIDDYATETPRWCKGCGDHGVLLSLQQLMRDENLEPENVVSVSGIGCSSRLPHYLRAYGFHGAHGRALTIATGVKLGRPEMKVITVMGDGDCFSIGGGHWVHTTRYNPDMLVLVLDNEIYALTKKQVSPTSRVGQSTNTTPHGAYLKPMNPLSLMLGISNVSFLAQTATWLPVHMDATIRKAWTHKGMSFVRIMQRCPIYMPHMFTGAGAMNVTYLDHPNGVEVDKALAKKSKIITHDPFDMLAAQEVALIEDSLPMGLLYHNPKLPSYEADRYSRVAKLTNQELIDKMNSHLDKYTVRTSP